MERVLDIDSCAVTAGFDEVGRRCRALAFWVVLCSVMGSVVELSAQEEPQAPMRALEAEDGSASVADGRPGRLRTALEEAGFDGVVAGIRASTWSLMGAPIELKREGLEGRVWGVTKEDLGGVVVLYQCQSASQASKVMVALGGEAVALRLEGSSLLAVVLEEGDMAEADALLVKVMEVVEAKDVRGQDALAALLGAMIETPAALPPVYFGDLTRAEVLEVALSQGWMLKSAPSVAHGERQVSVTYTLSRARQVVSLTMVQCLDESEAASAQRALADLEDGAVVRRGAALVLVMGDGEGRDALVRSFNSR